ncbi:polyprenyl synthetase family protein [Gracilibacillus timonensis]|uniref:polyprenyl synthetase family protein n=1 Tax=Gracilibacillus timonensis TaxID=1816696 RepID=UPI0008252A5F|nr:polyprenyl synthetase family protein [Gracilibacillus timonensis]
MDKEPLQEMAKVIIDRGFSEDSMKVLANRYVTYKFAESLEFARIAGIHYDIFRTNQDQQEKVKVLTIVELLILAGDIMDDIQDQDAHENVPWSQVEDSYNFNIVVGIILICLQEVSEFGRGQPQADIYQLLLQSINGQQIDLQNELLTEDDYFHMCFLKSGSLIAIACLLGAGHIEESISEKIKAYANYLGVIFQLRNDVNDMEEGFSKNDLLHKKRTLPILYYLNTDNQAYTVIQDYYLNSSSNQDVSIVHRDLMNEDALLYCTVVEKVFIRKFHQAVEQLGLSSIQEERLLQIATVAENG